MKKDTNTTDSLAVDSASTGYVCPKCGGNLYKDEGDEGTCWYECEKCDFECDSDFDRETGEIFPDFIHNIESELA